MKRRLLYPKIPTSMIILSILFNWMDASSLPPTPRVCTSLIKVHISPTKYFVPTTNTKHKHSLHLLKMEVMVSNELTGNLSPPPHFAQYYSSLPSSPSRIPHFYSDLVYFLTVNDAPSAASSTQKADNNDKDSDDDFAFFVSQDSDAASLTADELFDGGKIKTLKADQFTSLTKSPLVSNKDEKGVDHVLSQKKIREPLEERRGRDSTLAALLPSNSDRRGTRSLSPCRVSQHTWDEEHEQRRTQHQQRQSTREESSSSSKSSRKWKLRDLLLFRSASEGRGSGKDPLRKYSAWYKKPEDGKSSTADRPTGSSRREPTRPMNFTTPSRKPSRRI